MPKRLRKSSPQDIGWQENLGPWYSDGKLQSSVAHYNVPRSYRDVGGHRHDAGAARGGTKKQQHDNDLEFAQHMWASDSWLDRRLGDAVYYGGQYFHTQYTDERPVKRLRGGFDPNEVTADHEQSPLRNWHEEAQVARVWARGNGGGGGGITAMGDTEGNVERGTQGEVGLIPFKKAAYIQPTYTTASFKWITQDYNTSYHEVWGAMDNAQKTQNAMMRKWQYRVNSPLDPLYKTAGSTAAGNFSCNGWNEYRRRYKWYRLIKNRVKVTIELVPNQFKWNATTINQAELEIAAAKRDEIAARSLIPWTVGVSLNPGNRYPYGNDTLISGWIQLAQAKFTQWEFAKIGDRKVFTFDYEPGKWDAIVAEQQKETFWTKTNEAPPLFETFMVWTQPNNERGVAYQQITVEMDFTCQFREWTDKVVGRMFLLDQKDEDFTEDDAPNPNTNDYFPNINT